MREESKRRALQAAAKLAAVTLGACASPQAPKVPTAGAPAKTSAEPQPAAKVVLEKDSASATAASTKSPAPPTPPKPIASSNPKAPKGPPADKTAQTPASPEQIRACVGKLSSALDASSQPLTKQLDDNPELRPCCELLVNEKRGRGSVFFSCCMALGDQSPACTPWGPPMPPSLRAGALVKLLA